MAVFLLCAILTWISDQEMFEECGMTLGRLQGLVYNPLVRNMFVPTQNDSDLIAVLRSGGSLLAVVELVH